MLDAPREALWLPSSYRVLNEREAAKAVEEYDPGLVLGQRRDTNEWVVFAKEGPEGQPFPVFGLGTALPTPLEIKRRLHNSDVRRNGRKVITDILRRQEAQQKAARAAREEKTGIAAEHFEHAFRKEGKHPVPRIFIPGKDA